MGTHPFVSGNKAGSDTAAKRAFARTCTRADLGGPP